MCDVNGFSFVKNSRKYYDDASQVLMELMLRQLRPDLSNTYSVPLPFPSEKPLIPQVKRSITPTLGILSYILSATIIPTCVVRYSYANRFLGEFY